MADNVLKARIVADATGMDKVFKDVAKNVGTAETALKKVNPAANQATQSMTNLGRVVQDAPYGFIGIANNINPLLEGFQRLKVSTGSTSGALSAMGKSLLGAGGLGFAVSLISSGLVLFGDKLFGTGRKAKETEEILKGLATEFSSQAAKLTVLVGIVQNVNSKYEDKKKALAAINQEYKTYLKDLDQERVTADNVAIAYERIVDAMLKQAVVKGLEKEIAKAVEETAQEILKLEIETKKRAQAAQDARAKQLTDQEKEEKKWKDLGKSVTGYYKQAQDGAIAYSATVNQKAMQTDPGLFAGERIKTLKEELMKTLAPLLQLTTSFDDLGIKLNKPAKEAAFHYDHLRGIFDRLVKVQAVFSKQLDDLGNKRFDISANIGLNTLATNFKGPAEKISSDLRKEVDRLTKNNPILIRAANIQLDAEAAEKKLLQQVAQLNQSIQAAFAGAIGGFAEGLGEALAGGDIKDAFTGFVTAVGSGIQAIGQQLIQLGLAAEAVKAALKSLFSSPIAMVAAGIALVAIGAAIKKSLSNGVSGRRASGGGVVAGNSYIVGERGQEVFVPNTGGRIIPNNALGGYAGIKGGMQVQVAGAFKLFGKDLVAAIAQTNQSQRRLS